MQVDIKALKKASRDFLPPKEFTKLELMLDRIERKASRYSICYPAFSKIMSRAFSSDPMHVETLGLLRLISSEFPDVSFLRSNILTHKEHDILGSTLPGNLSETGLANVPIGVLNGAIGSIEAQIYRNNFLVEATTHPEKFGLKTKKGDGPVYFILQPFDTTENKVIGDPLPISIDALDNLVFQFSNERFEGMKISAIARFCAISEK